MGSAPPGGKGDARDDEHEADHQVPRAQAGYARYRAVGEVIRHDPGQANDQADHDGRTDPWRTDLPPRRLRRRRRIDRPLADARLGHDGLLRSKPGEANPRSNPVMRTYCDADLSVAALRRGRRDPRFPDGDSN